MNHVQHLASQFQRAHLDLEVATRPLGRAGVTVTGAEGIVQMDIARPARAREHFVVFPGVEANRIEVVGSDRDLRQLVLFVHEPKRTFRFTLNRYASVPAEARVVGKRGNERVVEQTTQDRKRHYLFGMDEQHLFIADLPKGTSSVHGAHEALRAPEVRASMRSREGRVVRQGEWFFLPLRPGDAPVIERAIAADSGVRAVFHGMGIAQAAKLDRAGRPHVADEIVVIREAVDRTSEATRTTIFVRGNIRHPDHRTVYFPDYRRVVPNRERFDRVASVLWID